MKDSIHNSTLENLDRRNGNIIFFILDSTKLRCKNHSIWPGCHVVLLRLHAPFMVFSVTYTFSKGLKLDVQMSRWLKVSSSLISDMILIFNISIFIMAFRVAYWDTLDDSLAL